MTRSPQALPKYLILITKTLLLMVLTLGSSRSGWASELLKLATKGQALEALAEFKKTANQLARSREKKEDSWMHQARELEIALYQFSRNRSLDESLVEATFALAAKIESQLGQNYPDFENLCMNISENYWRDRPKSRLFIEQLTEPKVLSRLEWFPVSVEGEENPVKPEMLQEIKSFALSQGRMLSNAWDTRRLRFLSLLYGRLKGAPERVSLIQGILESPAAQEAQDFQLFTDSLKAANPELGAGVESRGRMLDLNLACTELERGFANSDESFKAALLSAIAIANADDLALLATRVEGFMRLAAAGSSWSEIRRLPDVLTHTDLRTAFRQVQRRDLPAEIKTRFKNLLAQSEEMLRNRAALRQKAKDEVNACAESMMKKLLPEEGN